MDHIWTAVSTTLTSEPQQLKKGIKF